MTSSNSVRSGQCLCGAIQLSITNMTNEVGACHCEYCRKWSGGPFLSIEAGDQVEINGEEALSVYNSSDWAERGFCKQCGTHLFYRLKENQHYYVLSGLMGEREDAQLTHQLFIDKKPGFYNFVEQTETFTAEQMAALFAQTDN